MNKRWRIILVVVIVVAALIAWKARYVYDYSADNDAPKIGSHAPPGFHSAPPVAKSSKASKSAG
jgi:hypothetical protein